MSGNGVNPPVLPVRTLQIIVAAMVAGCCVFLAVDLIVANGAGNAADPPLITYIACAFAAAQVVVRLIVPRIAVIQGRRKIAAGTSTMMPRIRPAESEAPLEPDAAAKLAQLLMTRTIIAAAALEGAIFFLLVAFLVEHSPLGLMVAVVLIIALAALFPTRSWADRWIADQMRLLDEQRQLAR